MRCSGIAPVDGKSSAGRVTAAQTVATLCVVVGLSNCACIWINCSSRLLLAFAPPAVEVALDDVLELSDGAAVVRETLEPSA